MNPSNIVIKALLFGIAFCIANALFVVLLLMHGYKPDWNTTVSIEGAFAFISVVFAWKGGKP